jgi:hypothetical protein
MTAMVTALRRWLVAIAIVLAWGHPADAAPRLTLAAHDGRITVLAEPGLEAVARELAAGADAELTRIGADLIDLPVPAAVEVHLVRDAAELPDVAPGGRGAPAWAIGVAYPDLGVISVALARKGQPADAQSTLRHELAHIALGAALGDRAPHWLHEGFAYQHSAEWSWDRTETLAGMAWLGGIIALDELDASFPAEENPANRAYAQSYDFVGYLARRGRYEDPDDDGDRWPFRRFLSELGHGETIDRAAIRAYGRPIHELFDEWRSDLSKRYLMMPIGLLGLAVWVLCAVLVTIGWWRRRRQNRRRIARWDDEEREADRARQAADRAKLIVIPPYVPWSGTDPLAEPDETADPAEDPKPPRELN